MASTRRRYRKEEFAHRRDALAESQVCPHLTAADEDKFVAIDIETGEYELDKNEMKAVEAAAMTEAEWLSSTNPAAADWYRSS